MKTNDTNKIWQKRSTFHVLRSTISGFSLVETIVAVSIIILTIVGPMTAAQRGLVTAEYSRDQMKAYYLAEEGLEYIHYTRDLNALNKDGWLDSLDDCLSVLPGGSPGQVKKACGVDPTNSSATIKKCDDAADTDSNVCRLNFNNTTGMYSHQSGGSFSATTFRRFAKIYDGLSSIEKKVVVSVEWKTGSLPKKTITVSNFITDWKEQVGQTVIISSTPPVNPTAWWKFEGTGAESVSGLDAVVSGATFVAGRVGQAIN